MTDFFSQRQKLSFKGLSTELSLCPRLCPLSPLPQTLSVLPDQDSFYDVTDSLEQLGIETIIQRHMNNRATEADLRAQFTIYEVEMKSL